MRLIRFQGSKVHGYLSFDVPFNSDLTFLTGINGSGKTTIVNSMRSLLAPSLSDLARLSYSAIELTLIHDGSRVVISSTRTEDSIMLQVSNVPDKLRIPLVREQNDPLSERMPDPERDFYGEMQAAQSNHPVIRSLTAMPTPMFLGIERRAAHAEALEERFVGYGLRRLTRHALPSSLTQSLVEAARLVEKAYGEIQSRQRALANRLKRQMILGALKYHPVDWSADPPTDFDPTTVKQIRDALSDLGFNSREIAQHVDPFIARLSHLATILAANETAEETLASDDHGQKQALVEWFMHKPQFDRFLSIVQEAEKYALVVEKVNRPIDAYLAAVNGFIGDSRKELIFNKAGQLSVKVQDASLRPITALSSGESQIVVIITHLAFNPRIHDANVFVVDEPELSLHIRWQELFVDSIRSVNPKLQSILATHSPSIICSSIEKCVDVQGVGR
jgi:predicted ATP-binding protein involved in virulence